MKKRVFIIHGWEGAPGKNWMPWLKTELEKKGYEVIVPTMPNADAPKIDAWVAHLSKVVGTPNEGVYFIGHSIGCQAILRYLEKLDQPVGGAVFVAGWFNLENLEDAESIKIADPWINTPIDISKVKKILPKSTLIISENDSYGALKENIDKFSQFVSHTVVLPNAGHITQAQELAVLSQFMNLVQ